MLLIHVPIIFLWIILCTRLCYGMFSLVPSIMHLVFINLNSYLVLFVRIAMIVKKQLSIFFGTVPVGLLFVKNIPLLLRFFSIVGSQWPQCFLHCGWIECHCDYGIPLLHNLDITSTFQDFVTNTHQMFLKIILARHAASQVLRSTPQTPPNPLTPLPHPTLLTPLQPHLYSRQRMFHLFHLCTAPVNTTI